MTSGPRQRNPTCRRCRCRFRLRRRTIGTREPSNLSEDGQRRGILPAPPHAPTDDPRIRRCTNDDVLHMTISRANAPRRAAPPRSVYEKTPRILIRPRRPRSPPRLLPPPPAPERRAPPARFFLIAATRLRCRRPSKCAFRSASPLSVRSHASHLCSVHSAARLAAAPRPAPPRTRRLRPPPETPSPPRARAPRRPSPKHFFARRRLPPSRRRARPWSRGT